MTNIGETSIAVLALTVAMIAVQIISKWVDRRRNGNGKKPIIVTCPNKIDTLAETMHNIETHTSRTAEDAGICKVGVARLVEQHAPQGGVEQWKIQPRFEKMIESTLSQQREMLEIENRVAKAVEQLVAIQLNLRAGGES